MANPADPLAAWQKDALGATVDMLRTTGKK